MNPERDVPLDDEFSGRLEAYDEALAQGNATMVFNESEPPELRARLKRSRNCLELLQQLRPRPSLKPAGDTSVNDIAAGSVLEPAAPGRDHSRGQFIGRFEIHRTLGSGGFGVVYLAYDPVLCREVALKIPRAAVLADADSLARFQREARAAAALDHPNLVQVYEAGQLGPVNYITLAYCPGNNLAQWLKQRTAPVPCLHAAQLVLTLAQAIHYAHERGILHRDLKPANIMLGAVSKEPEQSALSPGESELSCFVPKITDFGLAKLLEGEPGRAGAGQQTEAATVLGTPCYMAPEQAEGHVHDVGPSTDVYALGAILYEVLTGRQLFWGDTPMAVFWQVKTADPLPPGRLRARLPRDLETICLKCLHKEPHRRYHSARALAEDLDRFLTGKPILARPTGRIEQIWKGARRRPALAATLVTLFLVTTLGVVGILWQWKQTQDALADEASALEASEVALYQHRVVLAHREWLAGNVGRSSQLLDECRVGDRAWEWRYVRHLCDNDLITLRGHTASVTRVAYSPDGRWLASVAGQWASEQPGEVKLWDGASGRPLWTGRGHTGPVTALAFSPDGQRLASTAVVWKPGTGGEIKIWEVKTGKALQTLPCPPGGSFGVAFSPDGRLLASSGAGHKVQLWDASAGKKLAALDGHKRTVFDVAFSPDGRLLASASWDGTARVWDVAALKARATTESALPPKPLHVLFGPLDLRSVAFSPNSKRLVAASYDRRVNIWDMADGHLLRTYWEHRAAVLHATFTPDGRWVVSSDTGGNVHVWEAHSGRFIRGFRGHSGPVCCVAFSPDGRRLATAANDQAIRVWDFTREQESIRVVPLEAASNVVFSPDGKLLAASGYLHSSGSPRIKAVRVWPVGHWSEPQFWEGHTDWVTCVAFSPDSKLLASGSNDQSVRLWDVATGKTVQTLGHARPGDNSGRVTAVSFSPDGHCLVSAGLDGMVKRWDAASGRLLEPVLRHPSPVQDVVYLPTGRMIAVGANGMGKMWDVAAGIEIATLKGHHQTIDRAVLSRDGFMLATAGRDHTICLWDLTVEPKAAAEIIPRRSFIGLSDTQQITGLAFSADGRRLASSGLDHTIRTWDVVSGNETLALRGHLDAVTGVAFSPNDRLLASASPQGIRIWEAADAPSALVSAGAGERESLAWYRQQADECALADPPQWFAVAFHMSRLLDAEPGNWRWLTRRAQAEAELGEWPRVLEDSTAAIAQGAGDPHCWYLQALALLQKGDTAAYRRCCTDMLERFARTESAAEANIVAWTCTLASAAVADMGPVIHLATKATKADPSRSGFHNSLGAALYRAGQFEAARASLRKALQLSEGGQPEDWLFLAMTCHQQGDLAEARRWLDKVVRWHEGSHHSSDTDVHIFSARRLAGVDLLRLEAEALLKGGHN
jgi:WD40 repeat protein/serine/threonine protein kinase